jgi:hypothetical protein
MGVVERRRIYGGFFARQTLFVSASGITDPGYKACATNIVAGIGDAGTQAKVETWRAIVPFPESIPRHRANAFPW